MPTAYTLIPRPKNLSTTATLIHRLRHPLRIQKVRHNEPLPASHSGSVRTDSDKRRLRIEARTRSGSPYELIEIEDRGEYSEQRYAGVGGLDVYWNSVLVEASEEQKARRKEADKSEKRERRRGRVFEDSEQLYKAFNNRQHAQGSVNNSTPVPKQTSSLPNTSSRNPVTNDHTRDLLDQPSHCYHDTNDDRYITLTKNTSVVDLNTQPTTGANLTWNSALNCILASPCVDAEIKATIKARACGRRISRSCEGVDMTEVSMVPNFSYPVAGARWYNRYEPDSGDEEAALHAGDAEEDTFSLGIRENSEGIRSPALARLSTSSSDSLYRAPTPPRRRTSDRGSILREILDPDELEMYQQIVMHDPRFTVLLDDADVLSRQVPLVRKLHVALCVMQDSLTDLKDYVIFKMCHDCPNERIECEDSHKACSDGVVKLRRAVGFSNRVLEACWKRECSLLNTLLDVRRWKEAQRSALAKTSLSRGDGDAAAAAQRFIPVVNGDRFLDSIASSVGSEKRTASNTSIKWRELDALIHIAAQNVKVLREDLGDVIELVYRCKE